MKIQTKNKVAGIILAFCALAIVICVLLLKNYKGESTNNNTTQVALLSGTSSALSKTSASATTTAKPNDPMVYKNTDYGFQIIFPVSMSGFTIKKTQTDQAGVIAKYSVLLSTSDKNYKNLLDSKAIAMEIYIYDPVFWTKPAREGVRSSEITKSEKYVYTYSIWEESPADLKTITDKDFVKTIETFKLTN